MTDPVSATVEAASGLLAEVRQTADAFRLLPRHRQAREAKTLRTRWSHQLGRLRAAVLEVELAGDEEQAQLVRTRLLPVIEALEVSLREL